MHMNSKMNQMKNLSGGAKYREIAKSLLRKIDAGEYRQNELIPQEFKLMEEFGVSRITVRNALNVLVNEGYLQRTAGRGTMLVSRESNLIKLRKGMNFGMFMLSRIYNCLLVSSLLRGLNDFGANLCVFPFLSTTDQLQYIKDTLDKNLVDGVFLGYFDKCHGKVVEYLKKIGIPFVGISDMAKDILPDMNYPRLSVDEVGPLTEELRQHYNRGVRRLLVFGHVRYNQMGRIRNLLKLTGLADQFEMDFTELTDQDNFFLAACKVMAKAVNRSDTLVLISGDELLSSYDAVFAAMPCFSHKLVNTLVYWHGRPEAIHYDYFARPYEELGCRAAAMMEEVMKKKAGNSDIFTPCHDMLPAFVVRAGNTITNNSLKK